MLPPSRFPGQNLAPLAAIALFAGWSTPLHGQDAARVQDIDLAVEGPGDLGTELVSSGRVHKLRVHHFAPHRRIAGAYTITMAVRTDAMEPLAVADIRLSSSGGAPGLVADGGGDSRETCDDTTRAEIGSAIAIFNETDTEPATRTNAAALRAEYASSSSACRRLVEVHLDSATKTIDLAELRRGQTLTLTISTQVPGGTARQWRRAYTPGPRGSWKPVYSFTFIGRAISERRYFARQSGSEYIVTRQHNRDWADFVPSVFFAWTPADADLDKPVWGWSGGLGFDMTSPVVMVGRTGRYNENIMFGFGIALHRQQVLQGRYSEGDKLSENLTETQMHSQSYRPNPFLSLGFRFGANPFSAP